MEKRDPVNRIPLPRLADSNNAAHTKLCPFIAEDLLVESQFNPEAFTGFEIKPLEEGKFVL